MSHLLCVADLTDGHFLTMPEMLASLSPEADGLCWSILDLGDVFTKDDSGLDVLDIERRVFASRRGLEMSFAQLSKFALGTLQVVDGLFVACDDREQLPAREESDSTIMDKADIVLAAFDSTFWLVSAADTIIERVMTRFGVVTEKDPTSTPLRS
jgi:hypothetical protein